MQRAAFKASYIAAGGSADSANSYISYLNRLDRICGGIEAFIALRSGKDLLIWSENQPETSYGGRRNKQDTLSAVRKYVELMNQGWSVQVPDAYVDPPDADDTLVELLRQARSLGARYYRLTGKPLGVTGEVAELAASETLGLELTGARNPGFDAWLTRNEQRLRVQIKGRAVGRDQPYVGRCPSIRCGDHFDICLLVLLDRMTLELIEIWEADEEAIDTRIRQPGSKARNERNSLAISQFKSVARRVWPLN